MLSANSKAPKSRSLFKHPDLSHALPALSVDSTYDNYRLVTQWKSRGTSPSDSLPGCTLGLTQQHLQKLKQLSTGTTDVKPSSQNPSRGACYPGTDKGDTNAV